MNGVRRDNLDSTVEGGTRLTDKQKPDTAKGSYYANPLLDVPAVSDEQRAACPEYYSGNVWPTIPEAAGLEEAFKALGRIIADVGLAIAHAADSAGLVPQRSLRDLIAGSQSNKARLLHYYPQSEDAGAGADDACGSHLDHSVLTGLCCAMYLDEEANIVPAPSANAGLFIYPRGGGDAVKVSIPPDCLAFQTGEAIELLSDGNLRATRHYVSSGNGATGGVSRETYAFFLQ
jgi:isopenicillin N synthase-like dioxygenase